MQFFLGFAGYSSKAPFDPSMMVHFRKSMAASPSVSALIAFISRPRTESSALETIYGYLVSDWGDRREILRSILLTSSSSAQINVKIHAGIDDTTRLVYVEVLADEQPPTVIGFISRDIAWFNNQGIESRRAMSDNVRAYVSKAFARCVFSPD